MEYTANRTKAGIIKTNVTTKSEGRCEYIDYEALKKGIATSAGSKKEISVIEIMTCFEVAAVMAFGAGTF